MAANGCKVDLELLKSCGETLEQVAPLFMRHTADSLIYSSLLKWKWKVLESNKPIKGQCGDAFNWPPEHVNAVLHIRPIIGRISLSTAHSDGQPEIFWVDQIDHKSAGAVRPSCVATPLSQAARRTALTGWSLDSQ